MSEAQPEVPAQAPAADTPTETPGTALQTPEPAAPSSWLDSVDADLREVPSLQQFKSVTDLAKSYVATKSKVGEKGLILPKPDASPQEVRDAMTALGCPETPDGYDLGDFQTPEGVQISEEGLKGALAQMHQVGINSQQAKPLLEWFTGLAKQGQEQAQQQDADLHAEWDAQLAKQWGTGANKRYELAEQAARQVLGDAGMDIANARLPNGGLLKHHPVFRDMMANVGDMMAEHQLLGETEPARYSATPDQAMARIKEFEADAEKRAALFDKMHPRHEQAAEEWKKLHEQAYPGKPSYGGSTTVSIAE